MPDRSRLHELIDTLPEEAVALAQGSLEQLQAWPPREPPQVRAMREANMERMRQSMRRRTGGGGGAGGSYRMGPGGRIEYGSQSHSHGEGDAPSRTADPQGLIGSWPLPFQDADLWAECQDFESNISAASEEDTRGGN